MFGIGSQAVGPEPASAPHSGGPNDRGGSLGSGNGDGGGRAGGGAARSRANSATSAVPSTSTHLAAQGPRLGQVRNQKKREGGRGDAPVHWDGVINLVLRMKCTRA